MGSKFVCSGNLIRPLTTSLDAETNHCSMDEALSLACELEAFRLLDGDWRRSSVKVCSGDEAVREPDLFKAQLEMLRNDIQMQQRQETQQVSFIHFTHSLLLYAFRVVSRPSDVAHPVEL